MSNGGMCRKELAKLLREITQIQKESSCLQCRGIRESTEADDEQEKAWTEDFRRARL